MDAVNGYDRGYTGSMAGDGKIYAHGLDVSAWQESGLNFQNFANAGYDFVILRCGTSSGKDKCFDEYYKKAKAAGLDVGCYYYSYATSVAAAKTDAANMISWMSGKVFEYPIYFDYEDPSQSSIDPTTAANICYAFMDRLKENGYLVGLYSMASWLEETWVTTSGIRGKYEGWVAHLTVNDDVYNTGITSSYYDDLLWKYGTRYGMHQYSFSTYVNGAGPFDCNVAFKDYPAIVKEYGFNGYDSETWVEKAAFDVMVYRDRNPDLAHLSDAALKQHWLTYGIDEGRASSPVLDLQFYLNNNPDLKTAFGTNYRAAYNHFVNNGYKEGRKSSALFDGAYYTDRYPEVAASYKDEYMRHYYENGMNEGRRASLTFDPDYYWFIRPDVAEVWPEDYSMAARHYAGHGINAQIEAYDHEFPVISDVQITDISAEGYTVSCKVTDNWGLRSVSFPTWTTQNDQDDLAADFMRTQNGYQNGDIYTFQVKASDHNNETGEYVTHIYAEDKGGNTAKLVLDVVRVEDTTPAEITPLATAGYVRSGELLLDVQDGTMAKNFLPKFENEVLEVVDCNGKVITGSAMVGTGANVNLYKNGNLVDSVTVVISGDVDGSGVADTTDYLKIKSYFLGNHSFNSVQKLAADVDGNGIIDATDCLRIKAYFLEIYDLYA